MKEALIYAAIGYGVIQTILLFAICAAAARPTPAFEPEVAKTRERHAAVRAEVDQRELELV